MGKYKVGDLFIGDFPVTQVYGNNVAYYSQISNGTLQNGHEGVDWGTPDGTPVIAPFDGKIVRDVFADKAYGNFLVIWDPIQKCAVWYCHLKDMTVSLDQEVKKGDLVGHTNNTGNTTGPHLHVNFVETDENGVRLNKDNGSQGFLNILDPNLVEWNLVGVMPQPITAPTPPTSTPYLTLPEGEDPVNWLPVKKFDFETMRGKCDKYDPMAIAGYHSIEDIDAKIAQLTQDKQALIDSHVEEIKKYDGEIEGYKKEIDGLNGQLGSVLTNYQNNVEQDKAVVQSSLREGHDKTQLSNDLSSIAAALKTAPDKTNILQEIGNLFDTVAKAKKQQPNIFNALQLKKVKDTSSSIWEKLFGIKVDNSQKGGD